MGKKDDEAIIVFSVMGIVIYIVLLVYYWYVVIPATVIVLIVIYYIKKNSDSEAKEIKLYRKQAEQFKKDWAEAVKKEKGMRAKARERKKAREQAKIKCPCCLTVNNTLLRDKCKYCGALLKEG